MPNDCITFQDSGYFTPIIVDYLNQKPELQPFYHRFPTLENLGLQIDEKRTNFSGNRETLVGVLKNQYSKVETSQATAKNIAALQNPNTFTITTGHQLNLF